MARPLTREQIHENRAFLRLLADGGNARAAARGIGRAFSTMMTRRGAHPDFARSWDAAVAAADARFHREGGRKRPVAPAGKGDDCAARADERRTRGGEPIVVMTRNGRLQVRGAHPNKLTAQAEQAFLLALSATANVTLSARAAGASPAAFYRRRQRDPAFAREYAQALARGYERLEMALLGSCDPAAHAHDGWRHNDAPPVPAMTAAQALQLMYLHQKEARFLDERPDLSWRRGETAERSRARIAIVRAIDAARAAEVQADNLAQCRSGEGLAPHEPPVMLPALEQVNGWSRAGSGKGGPDARHGDAALFGGWRMANLARHMDMIEAEEWRRSDRPYRTIDGRRCYAPRRRSENHGDGGGG
ncbi:hypothetical protein ACNI3Q_02640 [Sphingomonas sp. FW199]|uniref:hypothetical protein n=1 Tax=Sphingomonas sp. FW199 TaxID=3400217 RepID=UPI003CF6E5CB